MKTYDVTCVLAARAELAEHPVWNPDDQSLYWLDIENALINRFEVATGVNTARRLPVAPGCFVFKDGGGILVAGRDGFYDLDFESGDCRLAFTGAHDASKLRLNDGRADRQGRLWVGTVRADTDVFNTADNAYYRFDGKRHDKVLSGVGITNGTAFSPDGKTFYRAQTEARRIFAYDYDTEAGVPTNARVFAELPEALGMPDGATVDTEGGYWSAMPSGVGAGNGGVGRFTPDGKLDFYFKVPAPLATMVAFGGRNMSTLYITTGRLEAYMNYPVPETAGHIYAVETDFQGFPESKFIPC